MEEYRSCLALIIKSKGIKLKHVNSLCIKYASFMVTSSHEFLLLLFETFTSFYTQSEEFYFGKQEEQSL